MNNHEVFVEFTKLILNSYKNKHVKYGNTTMREHLVDNFVDMPVFDLSEVFMKKGTLIEEMAKDIEETNRANGTYEEHDEIINRLHGEVYGIEAQKSGDQMTMYSEFTPYVDAFMIITRVWNYSIASIVLPSKLDNTYIMYSCSFADKIRNITVSSLEVSEGSVIVKTKPSKDEWYMSGIVNNMTLLILATFRDIQKQNNKSSEYICYEDAPTEPKTTYLRKSNKEAVKVAEKPVIIILENLEDKVQMEKVVKKYERNGHKIEYSFSWVVRGHWRALHNSTSFGKDKNGKPVQGKTWVGTYLKGNVDMPIRRREIIVKDRRTA